MRFDKFTAKLQAAIAEAQSLAVGQGHNQLDPAHLLLALIDTKETGIKALIEKAEKIEEVSIQYIYENSGSCVREDSRLINTFLNSRLVSRQPIPD